jgi:hypothetical protein
MISNIIMVTGKMVSLTEMLMRIIIMVIFIKVFSIMDKDKVTDHMFLIKSIDIKVNGEIIHLQVRESYSEMESYFFKVISRMDSNMVMESINIKMETFLKETTLKTKSVAEEDIIFIKAEY